MVDPAFSMVTVQSEDSGIVWETASSRCSTPWASETSSISEAYSMEGPGAAGKITIVFDEEKIVRRRTRSGGRSSRLGDRLSRPGSSRSASALGVERLEMAEVSVPNVKQEKAEAEPGADEIKNKDQQLFSLISEGYEILNIRVPSKLPTVDEEESTELQDNLSYLDQTPKIKSRNHFDQTQQQNHVLPQEEELQDHQEPSDSQLSASTEVRGITPQKEGTGDIDYFEKFTLVDAVAPGEHAPKLQEEAEQPAEQPPIKQPAKPAKETATDSLSASDDSFVFVSDVEIVGEHLDEVFYGEGPPADALQQREGDQAEAGAGTRMRRESQRSMKENGSVLFGSEETVLTPIYISPGPPKIIDPILLEEPTAMSFMYSDLYEDAVGERKKSDEDHSEAESAASEKYYKRRLSDSEEADGYLEKFILKDETPTLELQPESQESQGEGRMMWSQSKFEMTGCLTRVVREEEEEDRTKMEPKTTQEASAGDKSEDLTSAAFEVKSESVGDIETEAEDIKHLGMTEEQAVTEESIPEAKLREDQVEDQEVKHEAEKEQNEAPVSSSDEPLSGAQDVERKEEKAEHQGEISVEPESIRETEQQGQTQEDQGVKHEIKEDETEPPASSGDELLSRSQQQEEEQTEHDREVAGETSCIIRAEHQGQTQGVTETTAQEDGHATEKTSMPHIIPSSEISAETEAEAEKSLSEETVADTKMAADEDKALTEALSEAKQPELEGQEMVISVDIETSAAASPSEEKEEVPPEGCAPVEIITDCDATVHAVVEVCEKAVDESEIQTQVQIDLQEVTCDETMDAQTAAAAAEREEEPKAPAEEAPAENQLPESLTESEQGSEVKTDISSKIMKPELPEVVRTDADKKQHQQEKLISESESDQTELVPEARDETEGAGSGVQEMVNAADELVLLVPKGQAVEMDIEISKWSEKPAIDAAVLSEPDSTHEHLITETTIVSSQTSQEKAAEPQQEETQDSAVQEETGNGNELDSRCSPPATEEEAITDELKVDQGFEKDEVVFSPLRSFTPQEDLSGLHREEEQPEAARSEQEAEIHAVEDTPEINIVQEDSAPEIDALTEDAGQKMLQQEAAAEAPEVMVEDLEYELISAQDAKEMPEPETQKHDAEEPKPESGQGKDERMEVEMAMQKEEAEEKVFDLSPEEELIEADYDIIDSEEESQARLAAELQGMDHFCSTCGCLLSKDDCESGEHQHHEVSAVDQAYEEIKEKLSDWISELQGRSEMIEDLVSELELAYNSVEDQCVEAEAAMQAQNEEMMALVMEQYNTMSISMEEEKKAKLEQLYDQIVSFQENIDSAKVILETTTREAETEARPPEDIHARLKEALDSTMSLELGPKGLLVFEDYAKGNASSSHQAQRKGIPVPQRPTLQPQEPGSATSTSVTVYWKVNPGDIIDCFQVYCMEDPHGAVSEEYRVTVKESYCVLEELDPDKTYKVWVMAVNYTGCSLPSNRLSFRTAPSVPVIDTERCTVIWDSATLRWSSMNQTPEQSYTLEYCRQYELEGEGLRSISGINSCEHKVHLQPNENYLFYIKAVNEAGASEQSEAALISTKGTRFHLLKASAHPALELSGDQSSLHYSHDRPGNTALTDKQCPSVLGELLLAHGYYYWETLVSESTAYRLGVAYSSANRNSPLGENSLSWCLQCVPTPSGCRYQLLHNDVQSSVFVTEMPERVGTLLDYQLGSVSFFDANSGQLLGAFRQRFTQPCHPAFALEMPGSLEASMVQEMPEFTRDS
ncbi:uncharacterized protein V6R79_014971 [Siganus canaliculatus]